MPDLATRRKQALTRLRAAILEAREHYCGHCVNRGNPDLCGCKFRTILEAASTLLQEGANDAHGGSEADEAQS